MLFKTQRNAETLIVPLMFSEKNPFPYEFIEQKLASIDSESEPIFLTAARHCLEPRTTVHFSDTTAYLRMKGHILDVGEYLTEISQLRDELGATSVVFVLAVPTAFKTSPEQHLETRCLRQIGEFFSNVEKMENASGVAEWLGAFGPEFSGFSALAGKVGAIISFETMSL